MTKPNYTAVSFTVIHIATLRQIGKDWNRRNMEKNIFSILRALFNLCDSLPYLQYIPHYTSYYPFLSSFLIQSPGNIIRSIVSWVFYSVNLDDSWRLMLFPFTRQPLFPHIHIPFLVQFISSQCFTSPWVSMATVHRESQGCEIFQHEGHEKNHTLVVPHARRSTSDPDRPSTTPWGFE